MPPKRVDIARAIVDVGSNMQNATRDMGHIAKAVGYVNYGLNLGGTGVQPTTGRWFGEPGGDGYSKEIEDDAASR